LLVSESSSAVTVATFVTGLGVDALVWTTSRAPATSPLGIVPRLHTSTFACSLKAHDALGVDANEAAFVPAGAGTVSLTPSAVPGPLLVTIAVYWSSWPASTGSGASVSWITTSAFGSADAGAANAKRRARVTRRMRVDTVRS
jgi:hypothetical protein